MQPNQAEEVKAWLQKGANDLRGAAVDLAASPPLIEDALFHCQQASEKALKGYLAAPDRPFRKTHDLDELSRACEELDPTLKSCLVEVRDLTVFAWEFRYPGETVVPSKEEALQALDTAHKACESELTRLPKEVHP